ncbi:unnamed protein product [Cylicocyclus nassatus]|uniref:Uncharacterized protein n=1 Tax=Cylicocyclus nassatus TaxID=53992 RepID=A0AA36GK68_CYLNA|nr:unnamed protein product [Cylicocyclus nassatus]
MTEVAAGDIPFQNIPHAENVSTMKCDKSTIPNATVIKPYYSTHMYHLFFIDSSKVPKGWIDGKPRLFLSKKAEDTCISVPVFHKANHRRLYFGETYNTTGYYFYNAYAFTSYCVSPEGDCLGKEEIREYVDLNGNFFYDKTGRKDLSYSEVRQTFYIAGID